MLSRRQILRGMGGCVLGAAPYSAAALAGAVLPGRAWATTAIAISLPDLVGLSQYALVAMPTDASSRWESVGNSKRIVTYVRVDVTHPIDGRPPPDTSLMIRTLGGRVGDIGQLVHGEARLELGTPAVVFLTPAGDGVLGVTAMAQGHYPLSFEAGGIARLSPSPNMPDLIRMDGCAVQRLASKTVVEAESLVSGIMLRR